MENEKKYTQVNNPTQINIGSTENSLQTAGRKVKEVYEDPKKAVDVTIDILAEAVESFEKGFVIWLKTIILPLCVCGFLAAWAFAHFYRHENVFVFLWGTFIMFAQVPVMLLQVLFSERMLPVTIVGGFGVLFMVWTTLALLFKTFKSDIRRRKKAVKLSLLMYILVILTGSHTDF